MGIVSGGSGSFNGGTITGALAINTAVSDPLSVRDPLDATAHGFDVYPGGAHDGNWQLSVWSAGGGPTLYVENDNTVAGGTSDLIQAQNNIADVFRVLNDGAVVTGQVAAPADALLRTSQIALWYTNTIGATALRLRGKDSAGTATNPGIVAGGASLNPIASGALPTTSAFVSATGKQILTTRDVTLMVPVTFNPTAGAAATCVVALSPDNVTYSNVGTPTEPAGIALDGTIHLLTIPTPAGWYVKLTVTNAVIGTGTYY